MVSALLTSVCWSHVNPLTWLRPQKDKPMKAFYKFTNDVIVSSLADAVRQLKPHQSEKDHLHKAQELASQLTVEEAEAIYREACR